MDAITTAAPNRYPRERMLQDMTMRGFGAHPQKDYIRHVRNFAAFPGRPPDTATIEDLRRFQIDQHERAVGPATINGAVSALRFFFWITLRRPEMALLGQSEQPSATQCRASHLLRRGRHTVLRFSGRYNVKTSVRQRSPLSAPPRESADEGSFDYAGPATLRPAAHRAGQIAKRERPLMGP